MNNWKEHPHLFANGQFEALHEDLSEPALISGVKRREAPYLVLRMSNGILLGDFSVNYSTLIARRIEDMSDEEWEYLFCEFHDAEWIEQKKLNGMQHEAFLYLLAIGVYPFDQSHFDLPDDDPAKVIDIKTIEP